MKRKAIIVFGGAGFIGSHLLRRLANQNTHRLVSVDIRSPRIQLSDVDYINFDIRDLSAFDIPGEVDLIYNLAAIHTTPGHPTHEYYETNIRGATEVTAFARRRGVKTIIFTSSISVYGPGEETKSETSVPKPESAYGWSKWLAEGIHRSWMEESEERRLIICRPAVIFGHGEGGNFTRLARLLRKGFFVYPGRKDTIKACYYVDDLITSILHALSLDERYILFNGCYADRYTLEQIVETFRADHFPAARTFLIPRWAVLGLAQALRPACSIGIHPDRVMKLVRSTDITPGWLQSRGAAHDGLLASALQRWKLDSEGRFD